jgi:DNA-binding SARP family transcriptional activator
MARSLRTTADKETASMSADLASDAAQLADWRTPRTDGHDFGLLGSLEVTLDGRPLALGSTKPKAVLALLLLRANQLSLKERMIEELWGDAAPVSATNSLEAYVSRLRKALGRGVIERRPYGYVLVTDPERIDAHRFERLTREGRAALRTGRPQPAAERLRQALALWRGPALVEFTFERFAQAEIARLEEARVAAEEDHLEAELALGHHDEWIPQLRRLVREHPLRERLWGQLILALYRCGRQAEALRAYDEVRGRLGDELGITPSARLQRLEEAVLLQRAELEWSPPSSSWMASAVGLDARAERRGQASRPARPA